MLLVSDKVIKNKLGLRHHRNLEGSREEITECNGLYPEQKKNTSQKNWYNPDEVYIYLTATQPSQYLVAQNHYPVQVIECRAFTLSYIQGVVPPPTFLKLCFETGSH